MLEMLILALVLSVFAGTVSHLLSVQFDEAGPGSQRGFSSAPLRLVNPTQKDLEDEVQSGPSWASFPRAF